MLQNLILNLSTRNQSRKFTISGRSERIGDYIYRSSLTFLILASDMRLADITGLCRKPAKRRKPSAAPQDDTGRSRRGTLNAGFAHANGSHGVRSRPANLNNLRGSALNCFHVVGPSLKRRGSQW